MATAVDETTASEMLRAEVMMNSSKAVDRSEWKSCRPPAQGIMTMPIYYTVDDIVDPVAQFDAATATETELNDELDELSADASELECLIIDLRNRLADINIRRDVVQDRLYELEDQQVKSVA